MTGLPDPLADPAGYVLAVADLREKRARDNVTDGWFTAGELMDHPGLDLADAEFVAFETPAHALAEVTLWRNIVARHVLVTDPDKDSWCRMCVVPEYPCADLLHVVAACQAYAGGQ